jgi:hypothetical protein
MTAAAPSAFDTVAKELRGLRACLVCALVKVSFLCYFFSELS